jgi:chromosome segregation ATPase
MSYRNSASLIRTIKQRKQVKEEQPISLSQVMQVVQKFLLPMFEADSRAATNKTRSHALGTLEAAAAKAMKPLSAISGTVYGELRLSEQLKLELTDAKEAVKQLEAQVNDALQQKTAADQELANSAAKIKRLSTEHELLRHQLDAIKQLTDQGDLAKALIQGQMSELKAGYIKCEEDRQRLTTELHDEKALNDKYRNMATELEHRNSLLRMENDVIGERLKGLYDAFEKLIGKAGFEAKVKSEFQIGFLAATELTEAALSVEKGLNKAMEGRDRLFDDFEDAIKQRNEMKGERDKLFGKLRTEIAKWEADYKRVDEERSKIQSEHTELEKIHKILNDEQGKTRQKLKQMRSKRRQFGEMEEKLCKNCGRSYYDSENYNWSCRVHFSQYGGELWWCCGKEGQNALGCRLSKHDCKEDEDEEDQKEGKAKISHVRCTVRAK